MMKASEVVRTLDTLISLYDSADAALQIRIGEAISLLAVHAFKQVTDPEELNALQSYTASVTHIFDKMALNGTASAGTLGGKPGTL